MALTKEEAIRRHRMMWEWIGNETLRRRKRVERFEAFYHFGWKMPDYSERSILIDPNCWACRYAKGNCYRCPIKWPGLGNRFSSCSRMEIDALEWQYSDGLFIRWMKAKDKNDWRTAAYYALYISMLPERK